MTASSSIKLATTFLFAILGILNGFWFHSSVLGTPVFLLLLLVSGAVFGDFFFPLINRAVRRILGVLLAIAWIMILGSLFYYFATLNIIAISIVLLSLPGLMVIVLLKNGRGEITRGDARIKEPVLQKNIASWLPKTFTAVAFLIFLALAFRMLARTQTFTSIRSPWEVLPNEFFLIFFLAAAALIVLALIRSHWALVLALPFFFLFFSVTNFVYPLGYGFDPFIHQATETYIAEHGTITPKPFTYIGQYALVTTTHAATALPIENIDRWLLVILLAVFLPIAGFAAFKNPFAAVLVPILPLTVFAATTPQAVADALVLITILVAIGTRAGPPRTLIALWLLGLATALTHPLAGAPLLIFLFLWSILKPRADQTLKNISTDFKKPRPSIVGKIIKGIIVAATVLVGSVILPLMFIIYGKMSGAENSFPKDILTRVSNLLPDLFLSFGVFENRFNFLLDFVYLYGLNLAPLLLLISIITAIIVLIRRKNWWILIFLLAALIVLINAVLLLAGIDFSFLPSYEQGGYAERLFDLAKIFILPIFIFGLSWGADQVIQKNGLIVRAGTMALLAGLLTASFYLTYPHPDTYTVERGFNVSAADFAAVKFINQNAENASYIVLANQAVSAAALKEFGFKQYYSFQTDDGPVTSFYYPIPTGGPLYQYFLEMSYESPQASTIKDAMNRAGVDLGYFVVDQYWSASLKIIEQAKGQTTDWWNFGDGQVLVFRFTK